MDLQAKMDQLPCMCLSSGKELELTSSVLPGNETKSSEGPLATWECGHITSVLPNIHMPEMLGRKWMPRTSIVPVSCRSVCRPSPCSLICFQSMKVTHPMLVVTGTQSQPLQRSFKWSFQALSNGSSCLPWLPLHVSMNCKYELLFCASPSLFYYFTFLFPCHLLLTLWLFLGL